MGSEPGNFEDEFGFDASDKLAGGGHREDEGASSSDDAIPVIAVEVLNFLPNGRFSMIGKPLIVTPRETASSRACVTTLPSLLMPSPEMSIT